MKWRVTKAIKATLPSGGLLRIETGQIIDMPPYKAMRFVRAGKLQFIDEVDGPPSEKSKTLDDVMTETILFFRDKIINSRSWKPSEATHAAERVIEAIQREVMAGTGQLLAFRAACETWWRSGLPNNATINEQKEEI